MTADVLAQLQIWGAELGFSQIGVADVDLADAEPGLLAWLAAGFHDIFASPGLKLAEWPEKAAPVLPPIDLDITLSTQHDGSRQVVLAAHTAVGTRMLQSLTDEGSPP